MTPRPASSMTARSRPAFTLVELVTALAISGLLLASLASMFSMSLRAMPLPKDDPAVIAADLRDASTWITDDLAAATSINGINAADFSVIVPDRDGDGATEKIAYAWSGKIGDPVLRTVNNNDPVKIGPGLGAFELTPWWRKVNRTSVGASALGAEETVFVYPGGSSGTLDIGSTMAAMTFTPVLPSDATHGRITSVTVAMVGQLATIGTVRARIYLGVVKDLSTQTAIASSSGLSLNVLGSATAVTFPFSTPDIAAGTQLTVVFDASVVLGRISIYDTTSDTPSSSMSLLVGSGSTWTTYPDGGMPIRIKGKALRPTTSSTQVSILTGVGVAMTPSKAGTFPSRFAVMTPMEPLQP